MDRSRRLYGLSLVAPSTMALGLLLSACGSEPSPEVSTDPSAVVPASGLDGPVVHHREREGTDGDDAAVGGMLILDGDCLYLGPPEGDGERFPVVWPSQTRWDAESRSVILPSGDLVAVGERVAGGGGAHELSSVGAVAGEEAESLVGSCLDNTYGEVTFFNNFDDAVRKH